MEVGVLLDFEKQVFEIFANFFLAAQEFRARANLEEKGLEFEELDKRIKESKLSYFSGSVKNYYGTVWFAYRWSEGGAFHHHIEGRYKEMKVFLKNHPEYKMKKIVLEEYKP